MILRGAKNGCTTTTNTQASRTFGRNRGVRTETHKIMHFYTVNEWEMFDLAKDPEEKYNLYGKPEHAALKKDMEARLERVFNEVPWLPGGPTSVKPSKSF